MAKAKSYEFHPLADAFPLMEGQEFAELVADIEANGQNNPIVIFDGKVLDGRNRYRACEALGIEPSSVVVAGDYDAARAYVISANIHRRHLDPDAKRKSIEALLRADPGLSSRAIAKKAGTDHKRVERVRKSMVAGGALAPGDQRVGLDDKTYPATAPKPDPIPEVAAHDVPATSQAEASAEQRKGEAAAEEPTWLNVEYPFPHPLLGSGAQQRWSSERASPRFLPCLQGAQTRKMAPIKPKRYPTPIGGNDRG